MFTKNSKVKEVLAIEGIVPIIEQRVGKKISPTLLKMAREMTMEKVAKLIKLSDDEMIEALDELNKAAANLADKDR